MFRRKTFIVPDNILQLTENIVEKYDLYNKKKLVSNSVKYIKSVFTEYEKKVVDLNFPECEKIDEQAFQNCKSLLKAKFPACKKIGNSAFRNCIHLAVADFPSCKEIEYFAFQGCMNLLMGKFPKCIKVGENAFSDSSLTFIYLPECIEIDTEAFSNTKILFLDLPKCRIIKSYAFHNCIYLTKLNLPECKKLEDSIFDHLQHLGCLKEITINENCEFDNNTFADLPLDCIVYNQYRTKIYDREKKKWRLNRLRKRGKK